MMANINTNPLASKPINGRTIIKPRVISGIISKNMFNLNEYVKLWRPLISKLLFLLPLLFKIRNNCCIEKTSEKMMSAEEMMVGNKVALPSGLKLKNKKIRAAAKNINPTKNSRLSISVFEFSPGFISELHIK
jgi:hypothetical protein